MRSLIADHYGEIKRRDYTSGCIETKGHIRDNIYRTGLVVSICFTTFTIKIATTFRTVHGVPKTKAVDKHSLPVATFFLYTMY
jgi:hypothetical protein